MHATTTQTDQPQVALPIVVGVDGTAPSRAALRWAARQAERTGEPIVVLATWEWPPSYGVPMEWPSNVDFEQEARDILKETVASVIGDRRIDVEERVVHGAASAVLQDASSTASLVVVGSRGHGELSGLLIGSVSEFLATHANCPVVIVRGTQ
jgi:nucleotide-binding universal stress UspA family protein